MPTRAAGTRKPLRVALVGWGAINRRVAALLAERASAVTIAAIGVRDASAVADVPRGAAVLTEPRALRDRDLDLVVEAAGREAVASWGREALRHAGAFAVASTSAFCDVAVFDELAALAAAHGSQLVVPPGALAGIDALAAAAALPLDEVVHRIVKPPLAWRGTAAETLTALDTLAEPSTFFVGTAREAASRFPQNANATVITALAGLGLERTRVELVADPAAVGNVHRLEVRGAFGRLELSIENRPLAANPKSSEMVALGLVRLIESRTRPVAI
jgi:aspartate dehydrogenase